MELLHTVFGEGKKLNVLQMSSRGFAVFLVAFALIRISGRRSFGLRMPLDNIITILLGTILSRAVVGASAFIPVVVCCFVVVLLHRGVSWLIVHSPKFSRIAGGSKFALFENGDFIRSGMETGLFARKTSCRASGSLP
jgi:uncharacterized membrane protein YcaP (DUF421 family)